MASLALGAAGAFIGSFFGPMGTSIGWMIGSAAGSMLFQKGTEGPRLTDLKLHNSSFGQMIPLTYGTIRIAGNVVWQTDLIEHKQKSGGKGGPTVTTFTYTCSFAVKLCAGPIGGVLRIWADSRLIYDTQSTDPPALNFTLYLGTEDQLPDPTIEGVEGVGNVNAMRGDAYIVFPDLLLTDYGNRIPSLTFEVYSAGQPIPWRYAFFGTTPSVWNDESRAGPWGSGPQSGMLDGGTLLLGWWTDHGTTHSYLADMPTNYQIQRFDLSGNYIETTVNVVAPPPVEAFPVNVLTLQCGNNPHVAFARGGIVHDGDTLFSAFYYDGAITASPILTPGGLSDDAAIQAPCIYGNDAIYAPGGRPPITATAFIAKWAAPGGVVSDGLPVANYSLPGPSSGGAGITVQFDNVTGYVWAAIEHTVPVAYDELFVFDGDLNLLHSWPFAEWPTDFNGDTGSFTVWNNIFYYQGHLSTTAQAWRVDAGGTWAFSLADDGGGGTLVTGGGSLGSSLYNAISLGNGLVLMGNGLVSLQARSGPVTLRSIVEDLSMRSGLDVPTQVDATELTDLVDGYVISQQAPTRSMIEPLQTAYFFDAVESDTQAKFIKRGHNPAASIPDADLGAYAGGGTPPPLVTADRVQEQELPRVVAAVYLNKGADYQNGTQISQRLITTSELSVSLQLPIVMDDKKAKEVTDGNLFSAWMERQKASITVPRKWTALEPTDVVVAGGYSLRVTDKSETVAGVIKLDGVVTRPYTYTQPQGIAVPGLAPPPTPPTPTAPTELEMLDIPLIQDGDFPNGYYAAAAGATSARWPGYTLYKSVDGGVNFTSLEAEVTADSIGETTTLLGPFSGGDIFDESNFVTVQLHPGANDLESRTELDVLNGANACLIGDEVLQYKNATLVADKLYTLSGLLRGRRGTEWASGAHLTVERFVQLPTVLNVEGPFGEIYNRRDFKGVTSGASLSTATDVPFTNNGVALRCYSPVQIGGGLDGSGNLTITWTRRTRIGGQWANLTDVPLSEATEAYVVQIWDAAFSSCARVITGITSPTVTYTAAQQVTDFGATQQTIFVTVGQIGTLGLGMQTGANLMGAGSTIDPPLNPVPPYNSGPPTPPPSGGCVGTVFNTTLTWATGVVRTTSPAGFDPGTNWVLKLTTPSSGNFSGALNFYEFGGPPGRKTGVLSTGACGAPLIAAVSQDQFYPSFNFSLGTPYYPSVFANLEFATDYYFSLQTYVVGPTAVDLTISAR